LKSQEAIFIKDNQLVENDFFMTTSMSFEF
jgi:hypothetical protein